MLQFTKIHVFTFYKTVHQEVEESLFNQPTYFGNSIRTLHIQRRDEKMENILFKNVRP